MINAISAAAIAFIMSSSPLIECSRPIRFFIVSVMYNNSGDSDSDSNSDNDSNGNSNSNHFIEVSKLLAELRYTNQINHNQIKGKTRVPGLATQSP